MDATAHTGGATDLAKVRGGFGFLTDRPAAGLHAVVVGSPVPAGRVTSVSLPPAALEPGFAGLFTAADVPAVPVNPACLPESSVDPSSADTTMLTARPRYAGDAVAVVVAGSPGVADRVARRVVVEVDPAPPATGTTGAEQVGQVRQVTGRPRPDVEPGWTFETRHTIEPVHHCCLEVSACEAEPGPGGSLLISSNTQSPADLRRLVERALQRPDVRVEVVKTQEGGGFGLKQDMYHEALAGWLALRLHRPVRITHSRRHEFSSTRVRGRTLLRCSVETDRTGRLSRARTRCLVDSGAYSSHTPLVLGAVAGHVAAAYPGVLHDYRGTAVRTNTVPAGAYRGYGVAEGCLAFETALDLAARELGLTPAGIRLRNLPPLRHGRGLRRCVAALRPPPPPEPEPHVLVGAGMAVATKHSATTVDPGDVSAARLTVHADGTLLLWTGTCDSGTGSHRALALIVAEVLGCPVDGIGVLDGDTRSGPVDIGSTAQRSVYVGGRAARAVAGRARAALVAAAAELFGGGPVELRWPLLVRDGAEALTVGEVLRLTGRTEVTVEAEAAVDGVGAAHCAVAVQVAVDELTGRLAVRSAQMVIDCGRVVDPAGARGQALGGFAQGVGTALIDEWRRNPDGSGPLTLLEHGVPRATDLPDLSVRFLDPPAGHAATDHSGIGEAVIVPVAAAVAGAFTDATGIADLTLPLRPDRVRRLLSAGR
jgi:CO/xanthine dehydrogenase Mo-binding subunit